MKKRVFVAIDLSREAREKVGIYLQSLRSEFSKLRVGWERAEKLHLTLKFLGDVDEKQLQDLTEAVDRIADQVERFTLQIAETGQFGKRVLWLGIKDKSECLLKIHNLLEDETARLGFEKEAKRFKPHLTIARLREPFNSLNLVKKHLQNKFEPQAFEVSEIVIFQSELQPTGSVYRKIKSAKVKEW